MCIVTFSLFAAVGANFGFNQSASGWAKGKTFFYGVQYLNRCWTAMNVPRPVVLVIDGYSGHHSLELFTYCRENEIILIVLYPNSTHILQVLDVAVFGPLKQKYLQVYQEWKSQNPDKYYNEIEFVKLLKQANDLALKKETIVNGWRSTGLQPFNFDNIDLSGLTQQPPQAQEVISTSVESTAASTIQIPSTSSSRIVIHEITDVNIDVDALFTNNESRYAYQFDETRNFDEVGAKISQEYHEEGDSFTFAREPETFTSNKPCQTITSNQPCEPGTVAFSTFRQENPFFSSFDDAFPSCSFGLESGEDQQHQNYDTGDGDSEKEKLVAKARKAVKDLGLYMKVHDPSKLLNILIMTQQLNLIQPQSVQEIEPTPKTELTNKDVLPPPSTIKPTNRKRKAKISFGVMTAIEVISGMEQRANDEIVAEGEREAAVIENIEDAKAIQEAEDAVKIKRLALKQQQNDLKGLKVGSVGKKKELALKRKQEKEKKKKEGNQLIVPEYSENSAPAPSKKKAKRTTKE